MGSRTPLWCGRASDVFAWIHLFCFIFGKEGKQCCSRCVDLVEVLHSYSSPPTLSLSPMFLSQKNLTLYSCVVLSLDLFSQTSIAIEPACTSWTVCLSLFRSLWWKFYRSSLFTPSRLLSDALSLQSTVMGSWRPSPRWRSCVWWCGSHHAKLIWIYAKKECLLFAVTSMFWQLNAHIC